MKKLDWIGSGINVRLEFGVSEMAGKNVIFFDQNQQTPKKSIMFLKIDKFLTCKVNFLCQETSESFQKYFSSNSFDNLIF